MKQDMNGNLSLDRRSNQGSALETVLDCIFDGVYIVDKKRQILFWNMGAEHITGYTAKEVEGRKCYDGILDHIDEHGNLLCKNRCPLVRTLHTGEHVREKIYPLHQSGRRFPVMTHVAPIRDQAGNIIAAIEVFRDITELEEFRILQEKFQSIIKKYVSTKTFEEVMEQVHSGSESRARMRDLTILYLDIVGFTTFSEQNPPEKVAEMLNNVFGICEVITKECHGDIDKFIGDAMMAVFIDANDAVYAANRILDALIRLNTIRRQDGDEPVLVRIGINSGDVIQGDIGTIERKDLTVIGDVVNTASRIQSFANPGSIVLSEATFSRLKDGSRFAYEGEITVKGRHNPVGIFRPVDEQKEQSPACRDAVMMAAVPEPVVCGGL
jgi:PAS domain S-box-containing protein